MMSPTLPLKVVQISDNHLFANPDEKLMGLTTAESLAAVLNRIRQLKIHPDIFLITGDLSQDETSESYEYLRGLITPFNIPTYWIPGNHDDVSLAESVLCQTPLSTEKKLMMGNWKLILLNSQCHRKVYGELTSESLNDLDSQLKQHPEQPTLIALHHPPLEIGSRWMDEIRLRNAEDFFGVIDRYSQVKIVMFGHIHQAFETTRNGVVYLGCPSTCVQFQPQEAELTLDEVATPGFRILTLFPNGDYHTEIKRTSYQLPTYPDPQVLRAMLAKSVAI
ncbi:MAG: 3',5'-cyclic-AMP phosphodiesterase [Lyngbya sp.]|nr:3',5'-cyclic-AMP phosphodiesterase [Lyngbya sp.]